MNIKLEQDKNNLVMKNGNNSDKISIIKSEPLESLSIIKHEENQSQLANIEKDPLVNVKIKEENSLENSEIKSENEPKEIFTNLHSQQNSSSALTLDIKQEDPLEVKAQPDLSVIKNSSNFSSSDHKNSSDISDHEILQEIKEEDPLEISESNPSKENSLHKCSRCDETFEFKSMLISHQASHFEKVKCQKCSKNIFKHKLEEHEKSHDDQWDFKCEICLRVFTEKATKKRHMLT